MLWRKSMKFLKKIFGSKQNKKSKFKSNTLAEANGSPDLRLATTKEKESDVPVLKKEEVKKIAKKPSSSVSNNTENTTVKAEKIDSEKVKATAKAASVSKKAPQDQKATEDKKATNKSGVNAKISASSVEKKGNTKTENAKETSVSKSAKTGKFEIKKSKDGRFVFNLYASNSVIVATSQVYTSSASAMNGIKSVIANAESAPIEDQTLKKFTPVPYPKWEIYLDKGEEYRFRLCASNGSCVCHSQGYTSKANCKNGIESIIKTAKDAEIIKAYLDKNDK